jgi:glycosyl hydrolase family 99
MRGLSYVAVTILPQVADGILVLLLRAYSVIRQRFVVFAAYITLLAQFLSMASASAASGKLVLAFYYPWYDQKTWTDPLVPDHPPDRYLSSDPAVMARQIEQAKGANIDAFVSAWYGPQTEFNQTETNLRALLTLAQPRNFSIAVEIETASPFFHSQDDVKNALAYALSTHATKPSYLKWNGKPVIFITQDSLRLAPGQTALAAWQSIRNQVDPNHNSLWIAEGFDMPLQDVFDGDFLYTIAWASDVGAMQRLWAGRVRARGGLWVGTVMPGWDDTRLIERGKRFKRERQNGEWYKQTWADAASANPDWIVITSWNEFVENTHIEPSANFGAQYLDLTRALAANWKAKAAAAQPVIQAAGAQAAPAPTQTPAPKPTSRPTRTPIFSIANVECTTSVWYFCLSR